MLNREIRASKLKQCGPALLATAAFILTPVLRAADANSALVTRGKYLVERASLCGDCHTPLNEKGEPDLARLLQGAPLGFQPTAPVPGWASVAPAIAGLPGMNDAQAVKFLTTGLDATGKRANPPMPLYRYSSADAKAVLAYLRSLKPATPAKP